MPNLTILARPGENLPELPSGFDHANTLLDELLDGIDTVGAFLPAAKHLGLCRVCGQRREMTFEHVPPRASGNKVRVKGVDMWTVSTSPSPLEFPTSGWFPSQRGIGGYVLCDPCNNIGSRYATAYGVFAHTIEQQVSNHFHVDGHLPGTFNLQLRDWPLGDIARSALIALMDVGVHDRLIRRFPRLSDAVTVGGNSLPANLRLGLTLALGKRGRLTAPICRVSPAGCSVFAEVSFAPFAWTLGVIEDDLVPVDRSADVSHWLRYKPNEEAASERIDLPLGFLHSPIPGDFRPIDQIESELPVE